MDLGFVGEDDDEDEVIDVGEGGAQGVFIVVLLLGLGVFEVEGFVGAGSKGDGNTTLESAFPGRGSRGSRSLAATASGLVDVVLGGYLGWFTAIKKLIGRRLIDPARTPALAAWEDRFRATEAARGVLPDDADKMLEFRQTALDLGASKKITL
uniref:Uncharacterized protein n=1 Tax=Oryza punctata TaxID=4537 RepID=A0A0E0MA26_ORYPU